MKKYLTLAAVLGAIAFVSVSFLAQADDHGTHSDTTMTEAAAPAAVDAVASECEASVAAAHEGKTVTDAEKDAALKACVDAKAAEAKTEVAPADHSAE